MFCFLKMFTLGFLMFWGSVLEKSGRCCEQFCLVGVSRLPRLVMMDISEIAQRENRKAKAPAPPASCVFKGLVLMG